MLSYRHNCHAGNFADVVKHVVLVALLQAITRRPDSCYVHDSHAGSGVYDFESPEALHAREFDAGIGRLWQYQDAPAPVQQYLEIVRAWNPGRSVPRYYPGSPAIAQSLLRQQDRLSLTELQPQEYAQLVKRFYGDSRIRILLHDAYQGLKALLPAVKKRGLVLIDPPYEHQDEFEQVITGLKEAYAQWHQGTYAIWYPILSRELQHRFLEACITTGIRKQLHAEFRIAPFATAEHFIGCGLVLVNPPAQLDTTLEACLHWLCGPLQQACDPAVRVHWLTG